MEKKTRDSSNHTYMTKNRRGSMQMSALSWECVPLAYSVTHIHTQALPLIHSVCFSLCLWKCSLIPKWALLRYNKSISFKNNGPHTYLLFNLCVWFLITIHLRLNDALYFPFPLWGLTFKCIHTDQSPKPDNTDISFFWLFAGKLHAPSF